MSSFSSTNSLVVFTQREGRIDMFDAGIPFKIPNVSAARNRNYITPSASPSRGSIAPQCRSASRSPTETTPRYGASLLAPSDPLQTRRVSAAGDFYIPGEQTPIGMLNPDLYHSEVGGEDDWCEQGGSSQQNCYMGRLWFNVEYNSQNQQLMVTVQKTFSKYNRSTPSSYDTFVRVHLMPSEDGSFQKTKVQKKTAMPTFDETFSFKVEQESLQQHQIKFVILEFDRSRKRYMTSFTLFSLKQFDVKQVKNTWHNVKPSLTMDKFGADLHLSICHEKNFNKLNVTILDVRNIFLPSQRLGFSLDEKISPLTCYVRVALKKGDKDVKVKSTRNAAVLDSLVLLKINQQLQFTVRKDDELSSNMWLLVDLLVRTEKALKEELVGELAIGPGSFASGSRVEQWMSMCDEPNHQIRMWHKLDYYPSKPT